MKNKMKTIIVAVVALTFNINAYAQMDSITNRMPADTARNANRNFNNMVVDSTNYMNNRNNTINGGNNLHLPDTMSEGGVMPMDKTNVVQNNNGTKDSLRTSKSYPYKTSTTPSSKTVTTKDSTFNAAAKPKRTMKSTPKSDSNRMYLVPDSTIKKK